MALILQDYVPLKGRQRAYSQTLAIKMWHRGKALVKMLLPTSQQESSTGTSNPELDLELLSFQTTIRNVSQSMVSCCGTVS